MSPSNMFASFTSSSGTAKARSDRFLDQAFAQTDAKIAGQDLDQVLAFARREVREPILQEFSFRDWPAQFLQALRRSECDSSNVNGSGFVRPFKRFECGLARVAMTVGDAAKFGFAEFGRRR